ncbi:WW domain-containing protein [Madurella fahalii]|uniref:WW domain-containing protein n=1 Tax=Madurella fahalii TaxID=1157608 RepID=A0ABQ0GSE5_9PEZI
MSSTDEALAVTPEARPEKQDKNPMDEVAQATGQVEAREAGTPSAAAKSSPSPSDAQSEGECSESDTSEQIPPGTKAAGATATIADETQPPLPNEPLPEDHAGAGAAAPPLPNEPLPSTDPTAPPLPAEPAPGPEDDGWEFHWNPNDQSYWFYNRFTGVWQQENPRVPSSSTTTTTTTTAPTTTATPAATTGAESKTTLSNPTSIAGGYNPAIHGSYDENAWYAQNLRTSTTAAPPSGPSSSLAPASAESAASAAAEYVTEGFFNRHTGQWQLPEQGAERHSDEAKARRQMRAYFDVDAAANMHDGRSLKAERAGIKPSRSELKAFKERRRQKKEEKRRAWLRD